MSKITIDEATVKLALEALEEPHPGVRTNFTDALKYRKKIKQAITALREAQAQAQAQAQQQNCKVRLKDFAEFVRADERDSWPSEMEAMERQVNILTDALNDRQRWFDAIRAQHKRDVHYWQDQTLNARADEREACANVCEEQEELRGHTPFDCAVAIRARSGEQK